MNEENKISKTDGDITGGAECRCAPGLCYPPIEECVRTIAAKAGAPVNVVAAALLSQAQEMNMSAEELVHTQYLTATGQSGFDPDALKATGKFV